MFVRKVAVCFIFIPGILKSAAWLSVYHFPPVVLLSPEILKMNVDVCLRVITVHFMHLISTCNPSNRSLYLVKKFRHPTFIQWC